jgi:heavy metal sensor kinase
MLDSVRLRLTLWHVGILALLLVTLSAGVYAVLRQNFYEKAGGILKSVCRATVSILSRELAASGNDDAAAQSALSTLNFPEYTLAIFDDKDRLLGEKPLGSTARITLPDHNFPADRVVHLYTVRAKGGDEELRRVAAIRGTVEPTGRTYTIVVSQSLTPLLGALDTDRLILSIVVLSGLLLAGLGGWFLSRKTLAPVLAMSEQAHRIGAENLDQRLPVTNPRDELGHLASTFNNLLSRLSSAFGLQRQFMADASHELRTPVSVIRTATSVTLEKERRNEYEYRNALTIIDEQVKRLTRIVDDMFQLARADAGRLTLRERSFYLDELLAETARAAGVLGSAKGVTVRPPEMPESLCHGDEDLLRQLISNLLDNAIAFSSPGGIVALDLQANNGTYFVTVSDTGPGIPPEAQAHIFERFFRGEKGSGRLSAGSNGAGAGLGLSIAKTIAEAHGGTLWLVRTGSTGTIFTFALPVKPQPPRGTGIP